MFLLDVIYIPPQPEKVDTLVNNPIVQDTIAFAEEASKTGGGSSMLNWGIPALLAALAATLYFIFKYQRHITAKAHPQQ